MLKGKTVLLGVTGSIAAYKIASLASMLRKQHADVHVLMTKNATNFIHPITFETLTGNKCIVDTFDRNFSFEVEHISLAKKADVVLVAPASANVIGKLANGIADDMLTTTILACTVPILISPAMNTHMYENPIVQDNLKRLQHYGMQIIDPASGMLACQDVGKGKMPEPELLYQYICREIAFSKDWKGKRVLVTAGPTQEKIDPVRYITNHSTGKMGYAVARAASYRGAEVTLVSGPTALPYPEFVRTIPVQSAQEMYEAVLSHAGKQDLIIMSAAVADYRPCKIHEEKVKKADENLSLSLEKTKDILQTLGSWKNPDQILCGFSMETEHMIENSRKKLQKKNLDLIVANNLKESGAGFGVDTNVVTLITEESEQALPQMTKDQVAHKILDRCHDLMEKK